MLSALSLVLAFNERDQLELVRAFSAGFQDLQQEDYFVNQLRKTFGDAPGENVFCSFDVAQLRFVQECELCDLTAQEYPTVTSGGALEALLENGAKQKFSVRVHSIDLDDTSLAAQAEDVIRATVSQVVRHYLPNINKVDVDLTEMRDATDSSPADEDFDFIVDLPPLETLDSSLFFLCPFAPNKQGLLFNGTLEKSLQNSATPGTVLLADALNEIQVVTKSTKNVYAVKNTQHYRALADEIARVGKEKAPNAYQLDGYDDILPNLENGAVFADFFRLWKLQRAHPELHLYEVDDELRGRHFFRPPLIYVPGKVRTDEERGNAALARAIGAATGELLRGSWDEAGYPFWTLQKAYSVENGEKTSRESLKTYAEQTKENFGAPARVEESAPYWPDLDAAEGALARVLGSGVLAVALGPGALAARSPASFDASWTVSEQFEDWVLQGIVLCLSRKAGRFVQIQKKPVDNSGARGLAGALVESGADIGLGMEARVCAAVVGAGEAGK